MSELLMFSEFVTVLDQHAQESQNFFDTRLLQKISSIFHYENCLYTVYDHSLCVSAEGINLSKYLAEPFVTDFSKKDMLAQFISSSFDSHSYKEPCQAIRGSDILSLNPIRANDHVNFIGRVGLCYSASLPINHAFRIAIHKNIEQGDFTDHEMELLSSILYVIRDKYRWFSKNRALLNSSNMRNNLMNHLYIGFLTTDCNYNILEYNDYMKEVIRELFCALNLYTAVTQLRNLLNGNESIVLGSYTLSVSKDIEIGGDGYLKEYYCFIAYKNQTRDVENFDHCCKLDLSCLTAKELEILGQFAQGQTVSQISSMLFISPGTVKTHLKNIYRKLGISNQRELLYTYNLNCNQTRQLYPQK